MAKTTSVPPVFVQAEVIPHAEAVLRFDYDTPLPPKRKLVNEEDDLAALNLVIERIHAKLNSPGPT